ncbi:MAG: hypothetical protein QM484_12150 [Woeseiaceae bacterium]
MQNTATKNMEQALIYPQAPLGEEEKVKGILENIEKHLGFVPDGLRLFSISPPLLETMMGNIGYFSMGGTQLSPILTAMIRYQISSDAGCSFCIDLNEGFLSNLGLDLDEVRASQNKPEAAPLNDKEKALLLFAVKSIQNPNDIDEIEMTKVRKQGWSDREIFDAVAQAANNKAFIFILKTFNVSHQGIYS